MTAVVTEQDALRLVLAMHRLVRSLRRAIPSSELPPTHLIVLATLVEHGALRLGELAVKVPCSQPTATTVVGHLESAGLLRRDPDPQDGRAVQVMLTELGRQRINDVATGEAVLLAKRMQQLSPVEQQTIVTASELLGQLAEAG
ncbi:MarR family transcriptional regulator [Pseudonocardiaceae bacterium YIM PH 21723]|nr:MarR family transcriptional regulator [Pseudonocardiaceae bacterium YIM PH 21723]